MCGSGELVITPLCLPHLKTTLLYLLYYFTLPFSNLYLRKRFSQSSWLDTYSYFTLLTTPVLHHNTSPAPTFLETRSRNLRQHLLHVFSSNQ